MATAPDSTPKRHLLSLPQELLDIILNFAYPAEDEKCFIDRAEFEEEEKERRRRDPSTFAPKDFILKVNQWIVSKAFFESATRAWVTNQHFRGYPFSEQYSTPFALVHLLGRTQSHSILVLYCTTLSVIYMPDCGNFNALPSLKYLTLAVDHKVFEASEPAFAWETALSQEQLETASRKSRLAILPKLKQIKLVAQRVKYAKTQSQQDQWSSNVAALELLLQEQQKFKTAEAPSLSKRSTRSRVQYSKDNIDVRGSKGLLGQIEPTTSNSRPAQRGLHAAPMATQKPDTRESAAKSQATTRAIRASLSKTDARKPEGLIVSSQKSKSRASEAQGNPSRANTSNDHGKTSIAAPPSKIFVFRIKGSVKSDSATTTTVEETTGIKVETGSRVVNILAKAEPNEARSRNKREAEKFYLPPPKRRALVKRDRTANEKPTRRMKKSAGRPMLMAERPALLSPGMAATLHGATQESTPSQAISAFLFGGTTKIAQTEGTRPEVEHSAKTHHAALMEETTVARWMHNEKDEKHIGPSNMVSASTQTEMKSTMQEVSTGEDLISGNDVVNSKNAVNTIIGHSNALPEANIYSQGTQTKQDETATATLPGPDVFSQGTQTKPELDQLETATSKLTEVELSSQGTQTEPEPDQAERITTKLTEAKVCSQSTQTGPESNQTEKPTTKLTEAKVCTQSTQTGPEFDEGEVVAKLKKLEQGLDILLASHTEPQPAAKPAKDSSVLLMMCSIVCFLLCLYVLMKMALSNEYVAFHLRIPHAQYLG